MLEDAQNERQLAFTRNEIPDKVGNCEFVELNEIVRSFYFRSPVTFRGLFRIWQCSSFVLQTKKIR